jgi:murein DD-endopeptidase MepM/ murein hydrolase activator NlpD
MMYYFNLLLLFSGLFFSCNPDPQEAQAQMMKQEKNTDTLPSFNELMSSQVCDGFDFPFGDGNGDGNYADTTGKAYTGWYIATHTGEVYSLGVHTGEDWNGNGGGNTDFGQPVYATAKGKVIASADYGSPWGNIILIEHIYLDDGEPKIIYSLYAHLDKRLVEKDHTVNRRDQIGTIGTGNGSYPAHLHFEMRKSTLRDYDVNYWPSSHGKTSTWVLQHYEKPSDFIRKHRKLVVPYTSDTILIAVKHLYRMQLYIRGKMEKEYTIGLGQSPIGHKQQKGDNRTPEGEYRIIQKSLGPFKGAYANFLGKAWMRINYPNNADAEEGLKKKIISQAEYNAIQKANNSGKEPPKTSKLGGGIGIHGWAGNWPGDDKQNLTWGCISLQNDALMDLYKRIPLKTVLIIRP